MKNEKIIPVTVRGSGTGLVGACVPLNGGIMIDTTKMNHFLELDENNFICCNNLTHKVIHWLYTYYKKDPAIIDRLKAEMEKTVAINKADF